MRSTACARTLEETFYPAMEDHRLPITVGQGAGARVVTLELPPFTLVGATTRTGLLTTPLRDRFGIQARLEPYAVDELAVDRAPLGGRSSRSSSRTTARSRSPRAAAARRAWPTGCSSACATSPRCAWPASSPRRPRTRRSRCSRSTSAASTGWTARSCSAICAKFAGGPVGLSTLAVAVGEEQDTIEDVYEPYLLQEGLIKRTPRGRTATPAAYEHLGLEPPLRAGAACSEARAETVAPARSACPSRQLAQMAAAPTGAFAFRLRSL